VGSFLLKFFGSFAYSPRRCRLRRASLAALLAFLPSCGETGVKQQAAPEVGVPVAIRKAAEAKPPEAPPAIPSRVLLHPESLTRFFETLKRVEEREATDDVRVLQFGDSHTAADVMTGVLRRSLQARFGDGGRGFVTIGSPYKHFWQEGVKATSTLHFEMERGRHQHGVFTGDGFYGLSGISVTGLVGNARLASDINIATSRIELQFLKYPHGGTFEAFVDGEKVATVKTTAPEFSSGFETLTLAEGLHSLEIRPKGDGEIRFFGAVLDRAQVGLTFDTLGVNGARVSIIKEWDEGHFHEQLKHRAPDLVILAYGTNESADDASLETHSKHWADVMGRIHRATPTAGCLIIGPPDRAVETGAGWTTPQRLKDIVAMESRIAEAAGCAFFDLLSAMGGEGTIAKWAEEKPARARKDRVHYIKDSYEVLGQLEATELLSAYDAWKRAPARPTKP
jgi:lysophospholipase L1-like esterase